MPNQTAALLGYIFLLALAVVGILILDLTDTNVKTEATIGHILTILVPGLGVLAALLAVRRSSGQRDHAEATTAVYRERDELQKRLTEIEIRLERTRMLRIKIGELEEGLGALSASELRSRLRAISHLRHEIDVIESKARLTVKNGG